MLATSLDRLRQQPGWAALWTLGVAWMAAWLCVRWQTPLPWMLGPMFATAALSMAGAPTRSLNGLRNLGQWGIGVALGLYFTPEMGSLVLRLAWAIALGVVWALGLGLAFSWGLQRANRAQLDGLPPRARRATAYFSGAIGGASEMTLLAEAAGARTDLVASAHSLRLMLVTVVLPFAMLWGGWRDLELSSAGPKEIDLLGLLALGVATAGGGWLLQRMGRTNPWFMGALLVAMGLALTGHPWTAWPAWISNGAQLLIGVSLGVRFQREFLSAAPRWMLSVVLGTLAMMGLSVGFAWLLSWATGIHPVILVLGTAPGGIAEMAITAKVLGLGVPVVTAFQVCRLVAVLLLVAPLYRWTLARRSG